MKTVFVVNDDIELANVHLHHGDVIEISQMLEYVNECGHIRGTICLENEAGFWSEFNKAESV